MQAHYSDISHVFLLTTTEDYILAHFVVIFGRLTLKYRKQNQGQRLIVTLPVS